MTEPIKTRLVTIQAQIPQGKHCYGCEFVSVSSGWKDYCNLFHCRVNAKDERIAQCLDLDPKEEPNSEDTTGWCNTYPRCDNCTGGDGKRCYRGL